MAKRDPRDTRLMEARLALDAKRVAAKLCRHCGGPLPCWSEFGDYAPGVSYTYGREVWKKVRLKKKPNRPTLKKIADRDRR